MRRREKALALLLLIAAAGGTRGADDFDAWVLSQGQVQTLGRPNETRLPVGSLQKPFLLRAWASTHPRGATPRHTCTETSGCWRPSGHGTLDLRGALRESCNTYFRLLSRDTRAEAIRVAFRNAGFRWAGELTEPETIGLPGPAGVTVAPDQLLASYVDLIRAPWAERDDVRKELLSGLKDSAGDGTASGLRLWGLMAKTGTVPAIDGAPLKTSGFAMVLDDAGFAFLGLLRQGTGREAAIRSGTEIARLRPGLIRRPAQPAARPVTQSAAGKRGLEDPVRVQMLQELRLTEVRLKNLGRGPVDSSRGFVGPGAIVTVSQGDHFLKGLWAIESRQPAFERRIRGAIEVEEKDGPKRIIATMTAREYADGVLKAELGTTQGALRTRLASAVLRFLVRGARRAEADVCDSTHCAWFVGLGPVPRWLRPDSPVNDRDMAAELSGDEWTQAVGRARDQPKGEDLWTADCGGDPVSPQFIWGGGDHRVVACPRHPKGSGRVWRREWSPADLASVFGALPQTVAVAIVDGQWMLKINLPPRSTSGPAATIALTYDEAHRRLAARMGWDAMPAPASRVSRSNAGFVAEGTGFGHRVGLCLGR